MRKIIPYKSHLKKYAKELRQNMTFSEVLLWNELKGKQLGVRFSRQIPIDNYIVDFYCKDLMLAIEIDGDSHGHEEAAQNDKIRQKKLESLGVKFLRFDDIDIKRNMSWVLGEVSNAIENNRPTPNPSMEGN